MKTNLFKLTILILLLQCIVHYTQANNNEDINFASKNQNNNNPNYQFQIIPGVCSGLNFDVENIGNKFCLISNMYYELDSTGTVIASDSTLIDIGQDGYDFCPSIAVSKDSTVHVITRVGGEKAAGFNLDYSKKQFGKEWEVKNNPVGKPIARNYIIDIVPSGDSAIYGHTESINGTSGIIHFYSLKGDKCDSLGATSAGRIRIDSDFKMKVYNDSLFLVSGVPDPNGSAYYMRAKLGNDLPQKLYQSSIKYNAGSSRKGQPDIDIDQYGKVHFTYGAQYEVYYCAVRQQQEIIKNKIVINELGTWHLDLGLSTFAVSDDGETILIVGLKTNGSHTGVHCDILWTLSKNGGQTWTYPQSMNVDTYAADGRLRPTLLYSNGKFYLFYYDNTVRSISMAILEPGNDEIEHVNQPTISPVESNHNNSVQVSLTADEGTRIFYTTDGTDPDISSEEYLGPFSLTNSSTVKTIACDPGFYPSEISEKAFKITLTGLDDLTEEGICIYPNPAQNIIHVRNNHKSDYTLTATICDITGKVVLIKDIDPISSTIDISDLKTGLYTVRLLDKKHIWTSKIMKIK